MLYYTIHHESKNKNVPWLIFLAGYTGNCETWVNLCTYLLAHNDYSILLIDNLGAGKSCQPEGEYTTNLMAEEVLQVVNSLNMDKLILIGHSLGGAVAQQIVLKQPTCIKQLILVSSFAKLDEVAKLFLIGRYELVKTNVDKQIIALTSMPSIFGNAFLSDINNVNLATQRIVRNSQTITGMFGQLQACLKHDSTKNLN